LQPGLQSASVLKHAAECSHIQGDDIADALLEVVAQAVVCEALKIRQSPERASASLIAESMMARTRGSSHHCITSRVSLEIQKEEIVSCDEVNER
jgi:hypothetical protein